MSLLIALPFFSQKPYKLTGRENKAGWAPLFNGKNFTGWRQCNVMEMPKNRIIDDNAMKVFTGEGKNPERVQTGI